MQNNNAQTMPSLRFRSGADLKVKRMLAGRFALRKRKDKKMYAKRKYIFIVFLLLLCFHIFPQEIVTTADGKKVILYQNHTWEEKREEIKPEEKNFEIYKKQLRPNSNATEEEIITACEMLSQGWKYTMPIPKSEKASWGVSDGRTTWWNGYWYNGKIKEYSSITPKKNESGIYIGDKQNQANTWRNGGSPSRPNIYMYLLSISGGPSF